MDLDVFNDVLDTAIETAISKAKKRCKEISRCEPKIRKDLSDKIISETIDMHEIEIFEYAMVKAMDIVSSYAIKFNPRFNVGDYYKHFGQTEKIDQRGLLRTNKYGEVIGKYGCNSLEPLEAFA